MGIFRKRSFRKKNKDVYQNIDSPPRMSRSTTGSSDKENDNCTSIHVLSKNELNQYGSIKSESPRLGIGVNVNLNAAEEEDYIFNQNQINNIHNNNSNTLPNNNSEYDVNYNYYDDDTLTDILTDYDDAQTQSTKIPTIDDLPTFIREIQSCDETYGLKPAKALRSLFALSEDENLTEINRIRMAREDDGKLIPALLDFLQRCEPSSSEQYLALLVLNNISIPKENKRLVGIEYHGAYVLSRLLCQFPDVPLICIILVNLSFCDSLLRKQLVNDEENGNGEIQLMDALAYALKVGTESVYV